MKEISTYQTTEAQDSLFDACALLQMAALVARELSGRPDCQCILELEALAKLLKVAENQLDGAMDVLDALEFNLKKAA